MYQFINNKISIPARLIYKEWQLVDYENYKKMCVRGKLVRTLEGRGEGREAYVSAEDLPVHRGVDFKEVCIQQLGKFPTEVTNKLAYQLEQLMERDKEAISFFAKHKKPNGDNLSIEKQVQLYNSAMILNAIQKLFKTTNARVNSTKIWQNLSDALKALQDKLDFKLPLNGRLLKKKYLAYVPRQYEILVHKGEGHVNSVKITPEVGDWLIAMYALPIKYDIPALHKLHEQVRSEKGWKAVTHQAIYNYLYEPVNMRKWIINRDGTEEYRKIFGHKLKMNKTDNFPNAYWMIDGTKIDLMYLEEGNRRARLTVDAVVDYYSEKIIGYAFVEGAENMHTHFESIEMGIQTAGCRPYLITYDRQTGHKSARMQELYSDIVAREGGTHYPHKARAHSNPIEQLFNRFQQDELGKWWFSDKQSIKTRMTKNQVNAEFILENEKKLPTKQEAIKAFLISVQNWNNAQHPKLGCTRNEAYQHEMPLREEIGFLDMANLLWLEETKPITYRGAGLRMKIGKQEHWFEVYDENDAVDLEFRYKYLNTKFRIRYHPKYLNDYVQLVKVNEDKTKTVVACAKPKREHNIIPVVATEGAKEAWYRDQEVKRLEEERDKLAYQEIAKRTGITNEQMMADQALTLKFGGSANKIERAKAEQYSGFDF
ncbi:hypothetical protein [Flavobacterium covae]|uniref:hypothetical protein n=1 Tax=Flavobacterium covae TaxID=2906076 RepID=UPI000745E473|nr:hypothetical protein [Flavobacterium covae]AMA49438.1 hypothetical protein AWN65_08195 [Flavobacterium covae]MCJ1808955.1 hypothetical protein [Flavobacterium covae]